MRKFAIILTTLLFTITLTSCKSPEPEYNAIDTVRSELTIPSLIDEDTVLPTDIDGVTITWTSNIAGTLTSSNAIVEGLESINVSLTATLTSGDKTRTKLFNTTIDDNGVIESILEDIQAIMDQLTFEEMEVETDLTLPVTLEEATITWLSSDTDYISDEGMVMQTPDGDNVVTLTATFTIGEYSLSKDFIFTVLEGEQTVYFQGYYLGSDGLTGEALKAFLNELIDDHTFVSYGDLRDALQDTDEDPDNPNNIILFYTGLSIPSTWDSGVSWNREHVWAKSHGGFSGDNSGGDDEYSDMHQIRPTLPIVNTYRSNLDFDNGGTLVAQTTDCYKDSDSFEPRDEVKGDVARIIFYMVVRYEGYDGELDLEMNENVNNGGPFMGKLSVLLEWHLNDLPDAFEINRNEVIFSYQGNRNPFIDYPEFAELIWGTN